MALSAVGGEFIPSVSEGCNPGLRHPAGTHENTLEYASQVFHLSLRKKFRPEDPHDFELPAIFRDFAREMKARRARRTHPQFCRNAGHDHVRDWMILQRKAHFEDRI